ncbi:hypothetical protein SUVC_11G1780 [Saccharomyces uvarum]|uniref:Secreted protein n=1 Tax=Saccharomyces uvarum TaxID=230603 RepID=A0AA35J2T2_SACUV|nr:hypothetical protein SUVC_11G1780 [Saccharomyces uvarum]
MSLLPTLLLPVAAATKVPALAKILVPIYCHTGPCKVARDLKDSHPPPPPPPLLEQPDAVPSGLGPFLFFSFSSLSLSI